MRKLLRRPAPEARVVYGTQPGRLWDLRHKRWVNEAESFRPTASGQPGADYSIEGPVYLQTSGLLGPGDAERLCKAMMAKA